MKEVKEGGIEVAGLPSAGLEGFVTELMERLISGGEGEEDEVELEVMELLVAKPG